jgi:hypothetical protein
VDLKNGGRKLPLFFYVAIKKAASLAGNSFSK